MRRIHPKALAVRVSLMDQQRGSYGNIGRESSLAQSFIEGLAGEVVTDLRFEGQMGVY